MAHTGKRTQPRILTFNFHEPYLCLMACTGLSFDVGQYEEGSLRRPWNTHYRPVPANLTLLSESAWRAKLEAGGYDVVIAQNEMNAINVVRARGAKLLVCHNRRTFLNTTVTVDQGEAIPTFDRLLEILPEHFEFVFISESKRNDYGISGRVIRPGINVEELGGYTGEDRCIIRVGNTMRQRNLMFDVGLQEEVCRGLPNRVIGDNPEIPGSAAAPSYEALLECYHRNRCMLHVSRDAYEDGYNLAMLEAMGAGMPVVALANWTSPITDGVDGFTSYSPVTLRRRLRELLDNPDLAREIGARGRETVARAFPIEAFAEKWRNAIFEAAERRSGVIRHVLPRRETRTKILMHYLASPLTTGQYFEEAARRRCVVLGAGFRLPEEVLRMWGFEETPPAYPPHQIELPHKAPYRMLLDRLPQGFRPDFYLWIDSGPREIEPDIGILPFPKVAYLIDTHVSPELRLEMARHFDCTFLAQKAQVELFRKAGIANVFWLPLACSPVLHDVGAFKRIYDVAYVGSFSAEEGDRRRRLLEAVAQRFPNNRIGRFWPEEMARIYAQSRIVVNASHNRDVNMRVFEAMAAGALLITDEADGLEDLFQDGVHLVIYRRDEDLLELITHYLRDEAARERIAAAGRAEVLERHTYERRIQALLETVQQTLGPITGGDPQRRKAPEYYDYARREVIQHVPFKTRRLLDVGCGAGVLGRTLKEERGVSEVAGIEAIPEVGEKARASLDRVLIGDIERIDLPFTDGYFDCIVCADVLEHLVEPGLALRKLSRVLAQDGVIVISIPNARFHEMVAMLSYGGWTYADTGIMDSTHLRFFTRSSIQALVKEAGLEVGEIHPLNIFDRQLLPRNPDGSLTLGKVTIGDVSDAEYEEFLVYQYVVSACKPGLDRLTPARRALESSDNQTAFALAADAVGVNEAERRRIMGKAAARLGDLVQAERYYREALEMSGDSAVAGEYGILLIAMNRVVEAKPYLARGLGLEPGHDRMLAAMGLVLLSEGNHEEAFAHMKRALEANYEHTGIMRPFLDLAVSLERLTEAEPIVRGFAEFYPGNLELSCDYAELLSALGRKREARDRIEQVLALSPDHGRARVLLESIADNEAGT